MGLRIRTNVQSLIAQRNLGSSTEKVSKHMSRLSSGKRITKAADDAAGLAISEVLRSDIRSLGQARRNNQDGISLVQVAEGGLEEINNIMVRLRELSIQGASDTIGPRERSYLDMEFKALKKEIDRIALSTEFNGTRLLTGNSDLPEELMQDHTFSPLEIQIGKDYFVGIDSLDSDSPINNLRMNLQDMNALTEGEDSLGIGSAMNEEGSNVLTKKGAQLSIDSLDTAMKRVAGYRAKLGALQNRMESTDRNLAIQVENLSTAKSRITDADFAVESAEMTQASILQQAGASILTQANQFPNVALKLLQM